MVVERLLQVSILPSVECGVRGQPGDAAVDFASDNSCFSRGGGAHCGRCQELSADPFSVDMDPRYHALHCGSNEQGRLTKRHDDIRDALAQLLSSIYGAQYVSKEPIVGHVENQRLTADVLVRRGAREIFLDVVVADPTCKTAVQDHDSTAIQGVVCNVAEARKRNHYREVMRAKQSGRCVCWCLSLCCEPTGMEVRGA